MSTQDYSRLRRLLLFVQIAALGTSVLAGCLASSAMPNRFLGTTDPISPSAFVRFRAILKNNLYVMGLIGLGSATAGVASTGILMYNGFQFGVDVIHIPGSRPHRLKFLLMYAPIELIALVVGCYSSTLLSVFYWQVLTSRPPSGIPLAVARCAGVALGLLVIAAVLESILAIPMQAARHILPAIGALV
jgi:uncharacterized membrane protein SpoIIM required for sporulation